MEPPQKFKQQMRHEVTEDKQNLFALPPPSYSSLSQNSVFDEPPPKYEDAAQGLSSTAHSTALVAKLVVKVESRKPMKDLVFHLSKGGQSPTMATISSVVAAELRENGMKPFPRFCLKYDYDQSGELLPVPDEEEFMFLLDQEGTITFVACDEAPLGPAPSAPSGTEERNKEDKEEEEEEEEKKKKVEHNDVELPPEVDRPSEGRSHSHLGGAFSFGPGYDNGEDSWRVYGNYKIEDRSGKARNPSVPQAAVPPPQQRQYPAAAAAAAQRPNPAAAPPPPPQQQQQQRQQPSAAAPPQPRPPQPSKPDPLQGLDQAIRESVRFIMEAVPDISVNECVALLREGTDPNDIIIMHLS